MKTHDEKKAEYLAFREAAKKFIVSHPFLKISENANVQVVEDGAFVELIIFIHRDALK